MSAELAPRKLGIYFDGFQIPYSKGSGNKGLYSSSSLKSCHNSESIHKRGIRKRGIHKRDIHEKVKFPQS